jgi:hypothetical protein
VGTISWEWLSRGASLESGDASVLSSRGGIECVIYFVGPSASKEDSTGLAGVKIQVWASSSIW